METICDDTLTHTLGFLDTLQASRCGAVSDRWWRISKLAVSLADHEWISPSLSRQQTKRLLAKLGSRCHRLTFVRFNLKGSFDGVANVLRANNLLQEVSVPAQQTELSDNQLFTCLCDLQNLKALNCIRGNSSTGVGWALDSNSLMDLSHNCPNLEHFRISVDIAFSTELYESMPWLLQLQKLRSLDIDYCLTTADINGSVGFLEYVTRPCQTLRKLRVSHCSISLEAALKLVWVFPKLTELRVVGTRLGCGVAEVLKEHTPSAVVILR